MPTSWIRQSCKLAAWLLLFAITVLSLVLPSYRPVTMLPHGFEHLIASLLMGFAFGLGYTSRAILVALLLIGFVGLIEVVQLYVPGRHARMTDFLVDTLAVCIGIASAAFAMRHEPGSDD